MASLTSTFLDPRHLARTLGPTTIYFGKDVQGPVVRSFVIILDWLPTRMDDYIWIQIPKLSFEPKFKRGRTTGSKYQHKNIQSQNLGFKGSFIFGDQARAPNTTQRVFSLHWLLTVSKRPQIMDFRLLTTSMFGQGAIVHDLWTKKHGVAIGIVTISGYWLCTAVNKRLKSDEGAKICDKIMNNLGWFFAMSGGMLEMLVF